MASPSTSPAAETHDPARWICNLMRLQTVADPPAEARAVGGKGLVDDDPDDIGLGAVIGPDTEAIMPSGSSAHEIRARA